MKKTILDIANASDPAEFLRNNENLTINSAGQLVPVGSSTLREDEHKVLDAALLEVATYERRLTKDLMDKNLVRPIGSIGDIISGYERVCEFTGAQVSMDGRTRSDKDRLTFDQVGVPIPIFHKEWEFGLRQLASSTGPNGLGGSSNIDTTSTSIATRIVMERIEDHCVNGIPGLDVGGAKLYGYATHPDRNTYQLQADWSSDEGEGIINDALAVVQLMYDELYRGPYYVYVGSDYVAHLQADYSREKGGNTIMQRLEAIQQIEAVKVADFLEPDEIIFVQMTSDVVDLAVAVDLQNIELAKHFMSVDFMTYAMLAIRVKSEKNQRCGVCHCSPA